MRINYPLLKRYIYGALLVDASAELLLRQQAAVTTKTALEVPYQNVCSPLCSSQ